MMTVTLYWPDTGKIEMCVMVANSSLLSVYTEQGMEWVQIPTDENLHWMPNGVRTERPLLVPETETAPMPINLPVPATVVVLVDGEEVESVDAPAGDLVLDDPGEYRIEPAAEFPDRPYRAQTVVLT